MADKMYLKAYEQAFLGNLVWGTSTIKLMLLNASHTFNNSHNFVSDIVANELTNGSYSRKTLTCSAPAIDTANGQVEFDCNDVTFTALAGSETIAYAVIYREVTTDSNSFLIAQADPANIVTNGSDVIVQFGADGLFKLTN